MRDGHEPPHKIRKSAEIALLILRVKGWLHNGILNHEVSQMAVVSAFVIICQQVLIEKDNVPSVIRMVDLFSAPPDMPRLPDGSLVPVSMQLYINIRLTPDDDAVHNVSFTLTRPDGSVTQRELLSASAPIPPGGTTQGDRGLNIAGPLGVLPTHFGRHQIGVFVDGERVAIASFFIQQSPSESSQGVALS